MRLQKRVEQPSLGRVDEEPLTSDYAGLNWSYSRRESLEQCTRRYFFQYYADALQDTELRSAVRFLRSVKNRYLRSGELVHLAISTYLKKRKLNRTLSEPWLRKWVNELFAKDRSYSEHIRAGGAARTEQYPPALLDEILDGAPDESELLVQAEKQMLECISNFFSSIAFSAFRALGESPQSLVERKFSLRGFPVSVSGKIDMASRSDSGATVVDWKTGTPSEGGAESLQLATYGIWATVEFGLLPEQVSIAKAYLPTQEVVHFNASEDAFANARARILQDAERMVILHRYGKSGTMEAFTPNPQFGVCRLCQFRGVCPEGRAAIDARNQS
jgi:PD-(D/E)XK nuclease superfamily